MKRKEYDRRIRVARAARDAAWSWFPESFYIVRLDIWRKIACKLRAERDEAREERDKALRVIARLAMEGVKIPNAK
jgi:hypothetical protein